MPVSQSSLRADATFKSEYKNILFLLSVAARYFFSGVIAFQDFFCHIHYRFGMKHSVPAGVSILAIHVSSTFPGKYSCL
jgi:hypothetical protein